MLLKNKAHSALSLVNKFDLKWKEDGKKLSLLKIYTHYHNAEVNLSYRNALRITMISRGYEYYC